MPDEDKELIGVYLQKSDLFPEGINVNFAKVSDNGLDIELSVFERGAGFTLACGSGACASFAAAEKLGFVEKGARVIFPGGNLEMLKKGKDIIMTGPANLVARGEYYYDY